MPKLDLFALYARTGLLLDVATRSAVFLARNDELTPQGSRARLNEYADTYGWNDAAAGIRAAVAAARAAAQGWTADATAQHMPTAGSDAAKVAAELEAARLLARGGEGVALVAALLELPATPGRTIALNELVARGETTREAIAAHWPEARAARSSARNVAVALAEIDAAVTHYAELLDGTRSPQAVEYRSMLPVYVEREAVPRHLDVAEPVNLAEPRMPQGVAAAVPPVLDAVDNSRHLKAQPGTEKQHGRYTPQQ